MTTPPQEPRSRAFPPSPTGDPAVPPPLPRWKALCTALGLLAVALYFLWFHLTVRAAGLHLFDVLARLVLGFVALLAFASLVVWFDFAWAMRHRAYRAALRHALSNVALVALPAFVVGEAVVKGRDGGLGWLLSLPLLLTLAAPLWPLARLRRPAP